MPNCEYDSFVDAALAVQDPGAGFFAMVGYWVAMLWCYFAWYRPLKKLRLEMKAGGAQ